MLSFFKAIGMFIIGCGLTNISIDSEILTTGSVNSFLTGKHFNRCKKIHPLLSLALQLLHCEKFLEREQHDIKEIKDFLQKFNEQQTERPKTIENHNFKQLFDKYEKYRSETFQSLYGKTVQIYLMYTRLVENYMTLEYSVRTGNFNLLIWILPKINIFFSFNHQNYARYLTIYFDKLKNVEESHPELLNDCGVTFMGIRRTCKSFSRIPLDLTVEQTVNADAASTDSGVINIINSSSARQKWTVTHSLRTSGTSKILEFCGITLSDHTTKDLKKFSIKKASDNLETLLQSIQ